MKTPAFTHSASDSLTSMPSTFAGHGSVVGVFDSGLGGLSVMQAIRQQLPKADILYVADSGHAPYGERGDAFIYDRSSAIVKFLRQQGAQVIVVACNTATAAAIARLRQQWADIPIIGVEPGVKPAVASSGNKRIGVLATPATLNSQKFSALICNHGTGAQLILQPCPGLAKEIERGVLDSATLRALVNTFCEPLKVAGIDTAVLGCTHYPLIRPLFQAVLGNQVALVDTADAVALQTARLAERVRAIGATQSNNTWPISTGQVSLFTSGSPPELSRMAQCWLGLNLYAQVLPTAS